MKSPTQCKKKRTTPSSCSDRWGFSSRISAACLADLGLFGRLFAPAITAAATRGGRTSIQSPQWKQGGVALVGAASRTSSGGGRHGLPLPHPAERMAAAAAAAKGGGVGLLPKLHPPRFELRGRTGGRHTRSGYWIGEASSGGGGGGKGRRR
jgi:hypothetical protein